MLLKLGFLLFTTQYEARDFEVRNIFAKKSAKKNKRMRMRSLYKALQMARLNAEMKTQRLQQGLGLLVQQNK